MKSRGQKLLTQRTDGDCGEDDVLDGDLQHRGGGGLLRPVIIIIIVIIVIIIIIIIIIFIIIIIIIVTDHAWLQR